MFKCFEGIRYVTTFPMLLSSLEGCGLLGALGEQLFERKMAEKDLEVGQDGYVSCFIKVNASSLL